MNILSKNISSLIKKEKPDLFIVLGDRYEVFAASLAAYISKVPIAHIHGGELTEGSLDDGFRHCITKMSNLHFVSHKIYKKRIIQLGEHPSTIYNVGALGVENIYKTNFFSREILQDYLKIDLKKDTLLVCMQPEIAKKPTTNLANETLAALEDYQDKNIVFTMPGADLFNDIIIKKILSFTKKKNNCFVFKTLGSHKYLSLLRCVDVIIGNSSSGIIESMHFGKYAINVGDRQLGREANKNILHVPANKEKIIKAMGSKKLKSDAISGSDRFFVKNAPEISAKIVENYLK